MSKATKEFQGSQADEILAKSCHGKKHSLPLMWQQ